MIDLISADVLEWARTLGASWGLWYNSPMNIEQRFLAKVVKTDSCWFWTGSNNGLGYGEIRINNRKVYAHRWAYEHWRGPIPEGLHIDHLCRNASCVNPDHLEPVTCKENVRRGLAPGLKPERRHETCKHGHPFAEYAYPRKDGKGRNCAECNRRASREYQCRKRAERLATS